MSITYGRVVLFTLYTIELYTTVAVTDAVTKYVPPVNVHCDTYINYVATDKHLRYNPWVVKLHACAGRDGAKVNYGCVPKTSEKVAVKAYSIHGTGTTTEDIILSNVTSCEEKCLLNASLCNEHQTFDKDACACKCTIKESPDTCITPFHWAQSACDCVCSKDPALQVCEKKKAFDSDLCKCACKKNKRQKCISRGKIINEDTCECEVPLTGRSEKDGCSTASGVSATFVAVIVIGEFLLLVTLFIVFKRFCEHPQLLLKRNCYAKTGDVEECKKDELALVDT